MTVVWSPELDAALVQMHLAGVPQMYIAERFGRDRKTIRRRSRLLGLPPLQLGPRLVWTPEMDAELSRLRNLGLGHTKIAKRVGVSAPAVKNRLRLLGFPDWPHGARGVRNLAA